MFVADTYTRLPAAVLPVTVTGEPATDDWSAGLVTVRVVVPCVWVMYRVRVTAGWTMPLPGVWRGGSREQRRHVGDPVTCPAASAGDARP